MSAIELGERATTRCLDCGKVYRVPDPERTYRCKSCGGLVRAQKAPLRAARGTVTCVECEAVHPDGTPFCTECGTTLDASPAAARSEEAVRLRREAQEVLERARTTIDRVTLGYRLGALAYGIATLLAVLSLARPEVPRGGGSLVVAMTSLLTVLLLVGSLHVRFQPFLWTVAVAALSTAVTVVHLVGPNPLGVAVFGSAAWAVVAYAGLAPSLRFRSLIQHHRDLYVLHHASTRTRRTLQGRTAAERHERLMDTLRSATRKAWQTSAAVAASVAVVSAAGTWFVITNLRAPELSAPAIERFETAWNWTDMRAMADLFDPRVREVELARLSGLLAGHGWTDDLPDVGAGRPLQEGRRLTVEYDAGELPLTASWALIGSEWRLTRVALPVPAIEPTLEEFAAAWRDRDPVAMAEFFARENQADMRAKIAGAFESRGWQTTPEILDTQVKNDGAGSASAVLVLEEGKVTTEWRFRTEGNWRLSLLRFPKR